MEVEDVEEDVVQLEVEREGVKGEEDKENDKDKEIKMKRMIMKRMIKMKRMMKTKTIESKDAEQLHIVTSISCNTHLM